MMSVRGRCDNGRRVLVIKLCSDSTLNDRGEKLHILSAQVPVTL